MGLNGSRGIWAFRGYGAHMRITGGSMRGRILASKVTDGVRPTTSRVREAMFSMVGQDLSGVTLLDAFGGTGLLSFEALSRGATVTTVERNGRAARGIQANAAELCVRLDLRTSDARSVLGTGTWDVVILDPPYADDPVSWVAEAASAVGEILVIEHNTGAEMPARVGGLSLEKTRKYGDCSLSVFRRGSAASLEEAAVIA
jgi:16S rRNA (guanine(966)-N(2))-methyltransferase RsmD